MTDVFTKKKRSEIMSLIRSKNTKGEIALRKLLSTPLYPRGYRYRIHYKKAPGCPDIAFVSRKIAVFMDGSFWHGYKLRSGKAVPKKYWLPKIARNMQRDKEVNRALRAIGWRIIRVWEHDVSKAPEKILARVEEALRLSEEE
jgi:DNA mismatch endonuclease, patch repair protein